MLAKKPLIIPAGGLGARRKDRSKPKILDKIEVLGELVPRLEYYLQEIVWSGSVSEVIFVFSPSTCDQVVEEIGRIHPDIPITWAIQELPMGFGHAVLQAEECFRNLLHEKQGAMIIADDLDAVPLSKWLTRSAARAWSGLELSEYNGPVMDKGVAYLRGERVVRVIEKPNMSGIFNIIHAMYYIADIGHLFRNLYSRVHHRGRTHGEYQLTDAIQDMIEDGHHFYRMNYTSV